MSNNVKVTGNLDVVGAATGTSLDVSGALQGATVTADATTNQLVLGTTNTTTISSTAPAASRVVTLHDAGAASNIVLDTGGAMTISNSATIGHVLTATSATASNWAAPAAPGGVTVSSTTVTLSSAQILGMFTTPVTLIAAPGAGQVIAVIHTLVDYTYGGVAFAGAGSGSTPQVFAQYNGYATKIFQFECPNLKQTRGYFSIFGDKTIEGGGVVNTNTIADITNKAVQITNDTAAYTTGNGSIKVTVQYTVITL